MTKITITTHQELFDFAIVNHRKGDFVSRADSFALWQWAQTYAAANSLVAPSKLEDYGIYYPPDEDDIADLLAEGIVVPAELGATHVYGDHKYCTVCRECITCALGPCRDGGPHHSEETV